MPRQHRTRSREEHVARFEELYEATFRDVLGYLLRRTQDPEGAADLVAEVFTAVWSRIDDVPSGEEARPWMFGVARNVLANHRRGDRRRSALAMRLRAELAGVTVSPPSPEHGMGEIGRVFRSLSEQDREVLTLAGWERLDAGRIAVVLGCARGTARVRLHRARSRFAKALRGADIDPGVVPSGAATSTALKGATR
ncbi:RNA polymerase sigma factor [Nocardiopsis sp. N85]|uniref:RNA polymerase sigma factor n=1 Tax=Nocardiopsis sp. N85 TaxID=3029400 RepID=UPI00237F8866|nr:RNA polymerase sigma factor [Nocardiopsis sp. N85]MDE3724059.1 RNA polymerase sigma factor [Nocardiopsis sp. N85]